MRAAIVTLMLLSPLAGCVGEVADDPPDFDRSCPTWFPAKGGLRYSGTPAYFYNTSNEQSDPLRHEAKWIHRPTDYGGHTYQSVRNEGTSEDPKWVHQPSLLNGSKTDFYEFDIHIRAMSDTRLVFEAYRAAPSEQHTGEGEEPGDPTGERLLFRDLGRPSGQQYFSQLTFESKSGSEADVKHNETVTVRVELTNGHGAVDPSNVRLSATYIGDRDGDANTPSVVFMDLNETRYYRHVDCID